VVDHDAHDLHLVYYTVELTNIIMDLDVQLFEYDIIHQVIMIQDIRVQNLVILQHIVTHLQVTEIEQILVLILHQYYVQLIVIHQMVQIT
jgi:hypothetical protein